MKLIKVFKILYNYFYKLVTLKKADRPENYNFQIHPTAHLYFKNNIHLRTTSKIWENAIIRAPLASITIGEHSHIGVNNVILGGENGIEIGNYVMLGPNVVLAEGNHEYRDITKPMLLAGSFSNGKIILEDDVWIGANCTITDNVTIGTGSIVGANSVVTKSIPPFTIYAGVPAVKIGIRK